MKVAVILDKSHKNLVCHSYPFIPTVAVCCLVIIVIMAIIFDDVVVVVVLVVLVVMVVLLDVIVSGSAVGLQWVCSNKPRTGIMVTLCGKQPKT